MGTYISKLLQKVPVKEKIEDVIETVVPPEPTTVVQKSDPEPEHTVVQKYEPEPELVSVKTKTAVEPAL